MKEITQKILDRIHMPRLDLVKDVLLPSTHLGTRHTHQPSRHAAAFPPGSLQGLSATQRERWSSHCRKNGSRVNADVSQSAGRMPIAPHDTLPTVTPQGRVVVGALSREILPVEKMMVHGLPVHKMSAPPQLTGAQLCRLGGNTMDVRCVGAAMLIGMSMVNAAPSSSARPRNTFVCMLGEATRGPRQSSAGRDRRSRNEKKRTLGGSSVSSNRQSQPKHKTRKTTPASGPWSARAVAAVGGSKPSVHLMDLF